LPTKIITYVYHWRRVFQEFFMNLIIIVNDMAAKRNRSHPVRREIFDEIIKIILNGFNVLIGVLGGEGGTLCKSATWVSVSNKIVSVVAAIGKCGVRDSQYITWLFSVGGVCGWKSNYEGQCNSTLRWNWAWDEWWTREGETIGVPLGMTDRIELWIRLGTREGVSIGVLPLVISNRIKLGGKAVRWDVPLLLCSWV